MNHTAKADDPQERGTGKWQLRGLPAYMGAGQLSEECYPCGARLCELNLNEETAVPAQMQLVSGAEAEDFETYLRLLRACGFEERWRNCIEDNSYIRMGNGERDVYVSYREHSGQMAVIQEADRPPLPSGSDAADRSEFAAPGPVEAEFFLYGLNMDPGGYNPVIASGDNTSGYPNCGMLLAIRCPDGSVILIDGGFARQFTAGGLAQLDHFLHRIAGVSEEEPVRLHWLLTHFHPDHTEGFYELLHTYPTHYRLENIFCNLPQLSMFPRGNNEVGLKALSGLIREHDPACREWKLHTGERLSVGGVELEVLYTHEDNVCAQSGKTKIIDGNDSGMVIKATSGGMSLMILGDINELSEERILSAFGQEILKSDIVQAAHHSFNHLSEIYQLINAPVAWFAQTEQGTVKNEVIARNSGEVRKYSHRCYYAGDITRTVGFAKREGEIREIYRYNAYL